jgi:hypothetical protein
VRGTSESGGKDSGTKRCCPNVRRRQHPPGSRGTSKYHLRRSVVRLTGIISGIPSLLKNSSASDAPSPTVGAAPVACGISSKAHAAASRQPCVAGITKS